MLCMAAGFECSVLLLIVCVTESDTMVMGSSEIGGWLMFRPTKLAPNNTLKDRQPGTWATNLVLLLKGGSDGITWGRYGEDKALKADTIEDTC